MITWDDTLLTGDKEIDTHHQAFFVKAERLEEALLVGATVDVGELLGFLRDYAKHHFRAEEERMRALAYPYAGTHHDQHRLFLERLDELTEAFEQRRPASELTERVRDLFVEWLTRHIRTADMPLIEAMREAE